MAECRTTNVRLISATHHPIGVADGRNGFRDDLFYRISGITLAVPSLRERPNDLPTLLANEIARASRSETLAISSVAGRGSRVS